MENAADESNQLEFNKTDNVNQISKIDKPDEASNISHKTNDKAQEQTFLTSNQTSTKSRFLRSKFFLRAKENNLPVKEEKTTVSRGDFLFKTKIFPYKKNILALAKNRNKEALEFSNAKGKKKEYI